MKLRPHSAPRGIALMVVMIAVFVLAVLAGAFAFSMKVETRLAMTANNEAKLIWLGRSGVERARWIVAQIAGYPYHSNDQKWAGGAGGEFDTNGPMAEISLSDFPVGDDGTFSLKITALEDRFNIHMADQAVLEQALTLVGVDAGEIPPITGAILDWIDNDDKTSPNGAESPYYEGLSPSYFAKDRPIDDLTELLLVRGVTEDIFWGTASTNHPPAAFQRLDRWGRPVEEPVYPVGLVELFTPISSGRINVNTASETVLQVVPGIDQAAAACIVEQRAQVPFKSVNELATCVNPRAMPQVQRFCDVRNRTYQVEVQVSGSRRRFYALLGCNNPRDVQVLSFYWKDF